MTLGSKRLPSTPSTKFPALGSDLFSFGVLIVHVLCAYVCPYMCVFAYMYLCLACAMKIYVRMMRKCNTSRNETKCNKNK
mmetsp:Transcript_9049/g.13234  ORF Transcript_9049/g.13234 Transcript_9049/m.13234 type:complete len:80 (-) Transcript_9049:768-1007(-)